MSLRNGAAALALSLALAAGRAGAAAPLSPEVEKDLGWLDANDQSDFFVRVSTARARGVLRIGVFGESNAAGVGVGDGEAFPAMLEAEFRSRGIRNVQVLSFAVGGYGAHQAHMLWRHMAQDYGLDVVVFCFWPFLPERDTSFLTPWSQDQAGSQELHARYILEDGGLRRVAIPGETRRDAVRRYWSWLPNWTDARYSRQTPVFIRRLLPRGRRLIENPFYYDRSRSADAEALDSYRLILHDLGRSGKPVVAWYDPQRWGEDFRRTALAGQAPNVSALGSLAVTGARASGFRSLFHAPDGHLSAVTHRNIARELFAALTGREAAEFETFRFDSPAASGVRPGTASAPPLRDRGPIHALLGGRGILRFHPLSPKDVPSFAPRAPDAVSLLLLDTKQPLFYVLDSPLGAKSSLEIRLASGREEVLIPLGSVQVQSPVLGRVQLPARTLEFRSSGKERSFLEPAPDSVPQPCWRLRPDRPVRRAELVVDGRILVDTLEFRGGEGPRRLCASRSRAGVLRLASGAYAALEELTRVPAALELIIGGKGSARPLPLGVLVREVRRRPSPFSGRSPIEVRTGPSGRKEAELRNP